MTPLTDRFKRHASRGFVSVITMLFLALVVLFILGKSLMMSGSKGLESQQQYDSVAAHALAESGLELSLGNISNAVNLNESAFTGKCDSFDTSSAIGLGRGQFQYVHSSTARTSKLCPIRVKGMVNKATRTLEAQVNFEWEIGTGNYGGLPTLNPPTMALKNPYDVAAAAVFNLAWRVKDSLGHPEATGNNAIAIPCTGCPVAWNLNSSAGNNAVGSLGSIRSVAKNSEVQVSQTLDQNRNYVEVGLILGGYSTTTPPANTGSYSDDKQTGNTSNSLITYGNIPNKGLSATSRPLQDNQNWCYQADTLVFGLSGRGPDTYNYSAKLSAVDFNSNGSPAQQIGFTYVAHYPNTDGTSLGTAGDVYADIWYIHNPYVYMTGATSNVLYPTTVTVTNPVTLKAGTYLKVYSGTGQLQAFTQVKNDVANATTFEITKPILSGNALAGANICGGICALFDNPSDGGATTRLKVTRTPEAAAAQQYAGGLACFSGVDKDKIKPVTTSGKLKYLWHEVATNE